MLANPKINVKLKLSALWASLLAFYIYGDYFELYVPGKVEGLLKTETVLDSPIKLLSAAIVIAIPALMIALSLFLQPRLNKTLNLIFGVVFTLVVITVGITSISSWTTFYVLYAGIEAILSIAIVWTAWKWPREVV